MEIENVKSTMKLIINIFENENNFSEEEIKGKINNIEKNIKYHNY